MSEQSCVFDYDNYGFRSIVRGFCSDRTQDLLRDQENCIYPIYSEKSSIATTTDRLIQSMCDYQTYLDFSPELLDRRVNRNIKKSVDEWKNNHNNDEDSEDIKLIPIEEVNSYFARVPPLEHTKHRYPWLCSLRRVGQQNSHLCAVTLLSRPPGPTVLVTSAHCAYVCKSEEGRLVPNCCCPNVGPGLCTDTEDCGTNAMTIEMTGAEAEVKCGEWDTATDTEEDYHVILPIEKITVHPDFNISRGEQNSQFVASDIATIHVSDENFEAQSRTHNINPVCLPTQPLLNTASAVHSGWSKPPPLDYVTTNAPLYQEFYGEFSKQWHYLMNFTKCEDPKTYANSGTPLNYPSNSYYPPGTVCVVEKERNFCPTSGESGSPLMVKDVEGRMVVEGINSFIKVLKTWYF